MRSDCHQRWTAVKRLRTDNEPAQYSSVSDIGFCEQFADHFVSKIEQLRHNIVFTLSDTQFSQPLASRHAGQLLDTIPLVTASEVSKLLTSIPS